MAQQSSFLTAGRSQLEALKDQAERALAQVEDEAFFHALDAESNSLALIVKHVGGNLKSRWTGFLSSDGEKPDRDRDGEFELRAGDTRASLMAAWNEGWARCLETLAGLSAADLEAPVRIRNESMTAAAALARSLAHTASHVGQIVFLAKHHASSRWKTLSIPRGQSGTYRP